MGPKGPHRRGHVGRQLLDSGQRDPVLAREHDGCGEGGEGEVGGREGLAAQVGPAVLQARSQAGTPVQL
jgi:hypothetical protein